MNLKNYPLDRFQKDIWAKVQATKGAKPFYGSYLTMMIQTPPSAAAPFEFAVPGVAGETFEWHLERIAYLAHRHAALSSMTFWQIQGGATLLAAQHYSGQLYLSKLSDGVMTAVTLRDGIPPYQPLLRAASYMPEARA